MSEVLIRPAVAGDVAAIVAMERASGEVAHWSATQYAEMVGGQEGPLRRCLLVAAAEDGVVGFLAGVHLAGEDAAEVESLLVAPAARRRGVALGLYAAFVRWVAVRGTRGVSLEVRESNVGAIGFYERVGFSAVGRRVGYYSQPPEDAVLMRHELVGWRGGNTL